MGLAAAVGLGRGDAEGIREYFDGKVVWVTGASGGFGEALCVALAGGARLRGLILSARRETELERVRGRCLELCPDLGAAVLCLDLSDVGSLAARAEKAQGLFGSVDVLINNGGVGFRGLGVETSVEVDRLVMDVDFFSGVALTKALLPAWVASGGGHVVQVSSVQAFFGLPGRTAYAAAKHAARGFYDALRAEVADKGVSVTNVCPGYIATSHSKNAAKGEGVKYPEGHTSKGTPPEVCCHWKNKGFCKYGNSCKFLHPEHKRGAGLPGGAGLVGSAAQAQRSAPRPGDALVMARGQLAGVASCPLPEVMRPAYAVAAAGRYYS